MSVPDLECGFSRDLFVQWTSHPKNSVILTSRSSPGCLARHLIDNPKTTSVEMIVSNGLILGEACADMAVFGKVRRRVYLEGEELELHRKKEREEKLAKQQAEK